MTNRQKLIAAIGQHASPLLRSEVAYFLESSEEPADAADAFEDVHAIANHNEDRKLSRECDDLLILVGFYRPRTEAAVICGRDRSPVRRGVRFDCDLSFSEWINR